MGQKGEVQPESGFVALTIEEAGNRGVDGAIDSLDGEVDVGVVVEVVAMACTSRARCRPSRLLFSSNLLKSKVL